MATKKKPMGRPSEYNQKVADSVCEYLSLGMSMRSVSKLEGMPAPATMFKWMREHDDFLKQYVKAKQESADAMAEEILDIADDASLDVEVTDKGVRTNSENIQRSRLRVDTRKWLMAKMKPKRYGDKLDLTTDGEKLPQPIYGGLSIATKTEDVIDDSEL